MIHIDINYVYFLYWLEIPTVIELFDWFLCAVGGGLAVADAI
jgi:hypothetical protein